MLLVALARRASYFTFACSKESNQIKEHPAIPAFGLPALLNKSSGCGTRYAQTVLAEIPRFICVARRDKGDFEVKTKPCGFGKIDATGSRMGIGLQGIYFNVFYSLNLNF
jgi:hypothetical protein